MPETICFIVAARPNFMKVAPVYHAMGEGDSQHHLLLVHTGQHYDTQMSSVFLRELSLPTPDVLLAVGSGSHAEQTARTLVGVEKILLKHNPVLTVVAGDVNSTVAAALASVKLNIPVAHIESGLRSFDDLMPEEHNRRLTDHMSHLLFAHSQNAVANLEHEGIPSERVHLVGNTMIDSLFKHLPKAIELEPWRAYGLRANAYALVTLHRPALVDDPQLLTATMAGLKKMSRRIPTIFPVHPRTAEQMRKLNLARHFGSGLIACDPLSYLEFLGLEAGAAVVVTDSGGIQEETSALGVPCFTLRDTTERPVTVELGTNTLLGARPDRLPEIPALLPTRCVSNQIPMWDGYAGSRAATILREFLERDES